mmetsp:Transcript_5181/g.21328  ORF Transcript_5181/g.21328 Transcript_5181/m.21328 type:complete len:333 (+) Transcript_5181:1093-2091(+)
MSSMRVICENTRTRDDCALSLGSSLVRSTSLPALSQRCGPSTYGGPGSAPSNRYGWLHTLRSCMRMLRSWTRSGPPSALSVCASLDKIFVYHSRCISVSPMYSLTSRFGGRSFSTSFLMRRNMKGRNTVWSFLTTFSLASSSASIENHDSKSVSEAKMSGSRKLSNAQSSLRLFWSGVPVMRRRNLVGMSRTTFERLDLGFLMRCASSMTRYSQSILQSAPFSLRTPSYDVTHTSNDEVSAMSSRMMRARSSFEPSSLTVRVVGHHFLNSRIQLLTTDLGTMQMCGPVVSRASARYARSEMVCSVLPRPISSARMPESPFSYNVAIHRRPST